MNSGAGSGDPNRNTDACARLGGEKQGAEVVGVDKSFGDANAMTRQDRQWWGRLRRWQWQWKGWRRTGVRKN